LAAAAPPPLTGKALPFASSVKYGTISAAWEAGRSGSSLYLARHSVTNAGLAVTSRQVVMIDSTILSTSAAFFSRKA
jgi:hypothetical protein